MDLFKKKPWPWTRNGQQPLAVNHGEQQFQISFFVDTGLAVMTKTKAGSHAATTAVEALYYFFSNQHERLSAQHLHAPTTLLAMAQDLKIELLNKPKTISVAALPREVSDHYPNLQPLISACKQKDLAVNVVRAALSGPISLPSPFTKTEAYCQESYEAGPDLNCLRFNDGHQSFFILQLLSAADGIYFPVENRLLILAHVNESHVQRLRIKLLSQFADIVGYATSPRRFGGVIASQSRPSHFYYDVWPALYELAVESELAGQLPAIIMRKGHDFNNPDFLFGPCNAQVLDANEIDRIAIVGKLWFTHVGRQQHLSDSIRYHAADQFLLNKAQHTPSNEALTKNQALTGCYPVLWLGVEGQKRCWLEQVEGYALILNRLAHRYPNLGVIFDGWTLPLTPSEAAFEEAEKDRRIMLGILALLDVAIKHISVIGETTNNKLVIGQTADFFIGNYSTGSIHISRFLGKPGFCHLSAAFSDIALRHNLHRHPNHRVYLLPKAYVSDRSPDRSRHDYVSYSIDPAEFYRFIDQRLDKVLAPPPASAPRFFIEPSYSVSYDLRVFIKMASHGNVLSVGAGEDKILPLANYPASFLRNQLVYGSFPVGSDQKAKLSADYLVWLRHPLSRSAYHATQLLAAAVAKGQAATIRDVFNAKHKALDNYYTRLLSGNLAAPFGQCTEQMLETALNNLRTRFIFIGIDEKPAESYEWLCDVMDWDRTLFADTAPVRFTFADDAFSGEDLRLAAAINSLDLRFYEAALSILINNGKQPDDLKPSVPSRLFAAF